jgi:hypothetical protein
MARSWSLCFRVRTRDDDGRFSAETVGIPDSWTGLRTNGRVVLTRLRRRGKSRQQAHCCIRASKKGYILRVSTPVTHLSAIWKVRCNLVCVSRSNWLGAMVSWGLERVDERVVERAHSVQSAACPKTVLAQNPYFLRPRFVGYSLAQKSPLRRLKKNCFWAMTSGARIASMSKNPFINVNGQLTGLSPARLTRT